MASQNSYGLGGSAKKKKASLRWIYLVFMIVLFVLSFSWGTQRVATYFNYHESLGRPVFKWDGVPFYTPWSVMVWESSLPDKYGFVEQSVTASCAMFMIPQFIILGFWFARRKPKGNKDLHGSARWAEEKEIDTMGYFAGKGVYVGGWLKRLSSMEYTAKYLKWLLMLPVVLALGFLLSFMTITKRAEAFQRSALMPQREAHFYLRHNGPEHILCFAPTRSGKGVGLILPTLLSWPGSSIVLDIKGENWALTAGWRKLQGHTCLKFDPSDYSGMSAAFNPLEEINLHAITAIPEVQNMAAMLVDPNGKGLEDHWAKASFAMMGGALLHCCIMVRHKEKRAATLYDLSCMLADETRTIQEVFEEMVETDHAALLKEIYPDGVGGNEAHVFVASSGKEMLNKAENEASGVVSTALTNLALYRDPVVAMNTAKCDFRINDLMNLENPVNLYLVISPADIDRLRPLLRLIMDMIIRKVCAKMEFADGASVAGYKHRLLLLLDEFTSLGKLPIMEKAIAYIAGYGGKLYIIVQDITQLNAVYGKDNALMANCHVRIAYAPNTIETAKVLSEMTGKTTVVETKTSLSGSRLGSMKNASVSIAETARPLLTPDECMRLPGPEKDSQGKVVKPGDMLIFTAGQPTIYGRQILYFLDPTFSARAKIKAPGLSSEYPSGVTDSVYYPRNTKVEAVAVKEDVQVKVEEIPQEKERSYESYLE